MYGTRAARQDWRAADECFFGGRREQGIDRTLEFERGSMGVGESSLGDVGVGLEDGSGRGRW